MDSSTVEKIYEIMKQKACTGSASFAEVQRACLDSGISIKGDVALTWPEDWGFNHILWAGVNEEFHEAFGLLISRIGVQLRATTPLVYMCDGMVPKFPLAKRINFLYKTPHWLPVVFEAMSK